MTTTYPNQFLKNAVASDAFSVASAHYLDSLQKKQQFGGTEIEILEESLEGLRHKLEAWMNNALQAAEVGDVENASAQLIEIIENWGLFKADQDLIHAVKHKLYLDPEKNPDIAKDFKRILKSSAAGWATELQTSWTLGDRQRKNDLSAALLDGYQKVILSQNNALAQAHERNEQYAKTALKSVKQASKNIIWMQQEVQGMFAHGANVMNAAHSAQQHFNQTMLQNLPRETERAALHVERQRYLTKSIVALVIPLLITVSLCLCWLIIRWVMHF